MVRSNKSPNWQHWSSSCHFCLVTLACATVKLHSKVMPLPVPIFFKIKLIVVLCYISRYLNYHFKHCSRVLCTDVMYFCVHKYCIYSFRHDTFQCSNIWNEKEQHSEGVAAFLWWRTKIIYIYCSWNPHSRIVKKPQKNKTLVVSGYQVMDPWGWPS